MPSDPSFDRRKFILELHDLGYSADSNISLYGAAFLLAVRRNVPSSLHQVIGYLTGRGFSAAEVRAGAAECLIMGYAVKDSEEYASLRPGDHAFYWVNFFPRR